MALVIVALVLATVSGTLSTRSRADAARGFHFDSQTGTPTTSMKKTALLIMVGTGSFELGGPDAEGGGVWEIVDNTTSVPKTILDSGTWQARSLVSYHEVGTYGVYASGTAVLNIALTSETGARLAAVLTIVCNIGAAGLSTGMEEGIYVTIGSTSYNPVAGLTIFDTLGNEGGD